MAYTAPNAAALKARFPEFANVENPTIDAHLSETALYVDDSWPSEAAFTLGYLLRTAHGLALSGQGSGSAALPGVNTSVLKTLQSQVGLTKFKLKDIEAAFSDKAAEKAMGDPMEATIYGRQFKELVRKYFGGGLVA